MASSSTQRLLIFGLGYCGVAVAAAARTAGFAVTGTVRQANAAPSPTAAAVVDSIRFDDAAPVIADATHLLSTVPPDAQGDAVLARYADAIAAAPHLRWIGYLSSTVVYGDRDGGWVDEDTPPAPSQQRGHRRLGAEAAWCAFAGSAAIHEARATPRATSDSGRAVDIFRLAGIYGPGRSAFDTLRSGQARRISKPGHDFGRIHRDDIAAAVLAAMRQNPAPGQRIFNLADDTPDETAAVIAEAARLLGVPPPPLVAFADAAPGMSPMARSFWAENRKVDSRKTQATLGVAWRYPSYREGLRAILDAEQGRQRPA
jgi:nucleoside-diphosphate-sugar epimerase